MKKIYLFSTLLLTLSACNAPRQEEEKKYYALYMYNYPRVSVDLPSGNTARADNLLYYRQEITPNETFQAPENPSRQNYEFEGWFKEKGCLNPWNFDTDTSSSSVFLYAKWGISHESEYIEPEYHHPEVIITDATYRVTGILNIPVVNNSVALTKGALNRLEEHHDDVSFAINYERREDVQLTSATFDSENMKITIDTSASDHFEIAVTEKNLSIADENSAFETKAVKYENNGRTYENYHILLGGSSSMENWSTSSKDMNPIVSYNHGIGGTTVKQWTNKLMERLVAPYSPKAVVYYVGVNDIINVGDSGEETAESLRALFDKTHEYLPNAHIFYILINKLPYYLHKQMDFDVANQAALDYAEANPYLSCINAGEGLLKENGNPDWAYFRTDGLHMSQYGYVIWGAAVKKAIMEWLG